MITTGIAMAGAALVAAILVVVWLIRRHARAARIDRQRKEFATRFKRSAFADSGAEMKRNQSPPSPAR